MAYKLLLMAPDGAHVTEGTDKGYTVDECCDISANMGSRWYFYPFHFVIKDKGRVIDDNQRVIQPPDGLDNLKGLSVKSVKKFLQKYGMHLLDY